jgi:glycerophosphoryl diester phosphodiesterase
MAAPSPRQKQALCRPSALIWPPLKIGQRRPAWKGQKNEFPLLDSALREGAEGIALEVQLSAQGVPVVLCGPPFSGRTSSAFPRQDARARVRLLEEVLDWVRDQRCMAFIVISKLQPGAEKEILKVIARAEVRHLVRLIAQSLTELQHIHQLDAGIALGLHFGSGLPPISRAKALGAEVLLPRWSAVSSSFIRRAHRASLLVIPWTVDSPRQMRRAVLEGVDGIITNCPAMLTETVARLQRPARP